MNKKSQILFRIKILRIERKKISDYLDKWGFYHTTEFIISQFRQIDEKILELIKELK